MSSVLCGCIMVSNIEYIRLYPPFGYSSLYKDSNLPRFNHQNATHMGLGFRVQD